MDKSLLHLAHNLLNFFYFWLFNWLNIQKKLWASVNAKVSHTEMKIVHKINPGQRSYMLTSPPPLITKKQAEKSPPPTVGQNYGAQYID